MVRGLQPVHRGCTCDNNGFVASCKVQHANTDHSFHRSIVFTGAGMHTNFSTKKMRDDGGLDTIKKAIYKLGANHEKHITNYGEGNELRLTGKFETASIESFSFGVANRGASVRIGRDTEAEGKGYFEDRRPSSNADPYVVTSLIMETCMGPDAAEIKPLDKDAA